MDSGSRSNRITSATFTNSMIMNFWFTKKPTHNNWKQLIYETTNWLSIRSGGAASFWFGNLLDEPTNDLDEIENGLLAIEKSEFDKSFSINISWPSENRTQCWIMGKNVKDDYLEASIDWNEFYPKADNIFRKKFAKALLNSRIADEVTVVFLD